jgi:very-short-patch-repair endonuclease
MPRNPKSSGVIFLQKINGDKLEIAHKLRKMPTPSEKKLWAHLRDNKIKGIKFRRQQVIEGFIVDFFCHQAKLVVEVDGGIHENDGQKIYDEHRRCVFKARGLLEIRLGNDEIMNNIKNVINAIEQTVNNRIFVEKTLSDRRGVANGRGEVRS